MICIPIRKKNIKALLENLKKAQKTADVIEIWFDEIKDLDPQKISQIFRTAKKPILYKHQGVVKNLEMVLKKSPTYIDFDIQTAKTVIRKAKSLSPKTKVIISFHDFKSTPPRKDLQKITKNMENRGADIYKLAPFAKSIQDSLSILSFISDVAPKKKIIALCMGKHGRITRITGHLFGNYLMYAPLTKRDKTAPGQITAEELCHLRSVL